MKIQEAIVLAGGLGTRLRSAVPNLPKCMAPVNGRPFMAHVLDYFRAQGIGKFIFSLGYMHEVIEQYLGTEYLTGDASLSFSYVVEEEPLGTGGAIQAACQLATEDNLLVLNGDTLFKVHTGQLAGFHHQHQAACTLALKPMQDFDRYGVVTLREDGSVSGFREKQWYAQGLINGGVYALNAPRLLASGLPEKYSFEKEYLERHLNDPQGNPAVYGIVQNQYFIDIGIPADYERAQRELASPC